MEQHSDHPKPEPMTAHVVEYALARQDLRDALFLLRRAEQRFNRYTCGNPLVPAAAHIATGSVVASVANLCDLLEVRA